MMIKISILITLLSYLFCTMVHGASPCSEYFTYFTDNETTDILGQIEIPSPPVNEEFYLRVAIKTEILSNQVPSSRDQVRLALARSVEESVRAIQQGRPLLYNVYFPSHLNPIISAIWFNDQKYCPASGNIEATIELEHIVYPPNEDQNSRPNNLFHRNISTHRINDPDPYRLNYLNLIYSTPATVTLLDESSTGNNNDNECGVSSLTESNINLLISNGEKTSPGQWPWVVALFIVRNVYAFQCGGSILTNRHILTAAHCLKISPSSNDTIHPNVLEVALGRFNLRQWHEVGTVNREVASYKIHPDYAHEKTGDSDLAILTLRKTVEFNPFIRPICLWSGSTSLRKIENRVGYVVGWGEDELGRPYTDDPRMVRVPIVSQETCLRSHQVFVTLTSERTFCAGLRDHSGPCNGDSGSGLVLFDAATGRYRLRGVVSRSLGGNIPSCDLQNYVVYVDVAKYKSWIQEQISNNNNNNNSNDNNNNNKNNYNNYNECGINGLSVRTNEQIADGQKTLPGQWPWQAAIFNIRNNKSQLQCVGSVLTARHVLTVAHCLNGIVAKYPKDPNELEVVLGRFNLNEEETVKRKVASYKIHPNYIKDRITDSNLAVLTLKMPIEFGPFVRPICLWSGSMGTDLQVIVGRTGYIRIWSRNESNYPVHTEETVMSRVPIVSQETCLRNDERFFSLTSDRTFCAGLLDKRGPCTGDSGSGLTLFDAVTGRHQLRGIVSTGLRDPSTSSCDFKKYNVYVDLVKFLPWIHQQISII